MELGRTYVVTRPNPAIPGRSFIAMRGSDILKPAPGCHTYREASTGTRS